MQDKPIWKPQKRMRAIHHIGFVVDDEMNDLITKLAHKYGTSKKEFVRQAVMFALDHLEDAG